MDLPRFGFVSLLKQPLADGVAQEADWMARVAATGRATAWLWQGEPGWVVPRRYATLPGWPAVQARLGPRLQVRASGGGVVPQGPGVWNLSLIWPAPPEGARASEAIYRALCRELAAALARLGLQAQPQAVAGSFCDGRFNLAVRGRKLAGTAQAWRRVAGVPLVLAHAVLVVDADVQALTAQANALEQALGTDTRYRAEALSSVAAELGGADIEARTLQALARHFARLVPPHEPSHKEPRHGSA